MVRTLLEPGLDRGHQRLIEDIATFGWHYATTPTQNGALGWTFTVGLDHTFGHPEIVVFGLPSEVGPWLIHAAVDAIRDGEAFEPGREYNDLLDGATCVVRPVDPRWHLPFLGAARWFHRGDGFRAVQLFWPDRSGRYPWQPDFQPTLVDDQPLLFETDPAAAKVRGWM